MTHGTGTTPPGKLIEVGDHSLHLLSVGQGGPTVVFEAGLGNCHIDFMPQLERLSAHTTVCAYDRAGYGFSHAAPEPRDLNALVADLEALLRASGQNPPFILVGHSYGGLVVLNCAHRNPDLVAGVVLLDTSHPSQFERFREVPEMAVVMEKQAAGNLSIGNTSLIVISRGVPFGEDPNAEAMKALGMTSEASVLVDEIWSELQLDLCTNSTDSKRLIAPRGNHYVHYAESELVENAILELVQRARDAT